jgi:two-component system NtrC family sensor kinase
MPQVRKDADMEGSQYYRALTRNMLLTVILVSLAPLVLILAIIGYKFETSYREKVVAHLKELVQKHEQSIDGFLHERLCNIALLAKRYTFAQVSSEAVLEQALANLQSIYGSVFVDLGVVDEQGIQVAYAGPFKLERADYSKAAWFNDAVLSDYYISDVFLGLRRQPHFIVAAKQESGGKTWIVRGTIDFLAFNTLVESVSIGKTGSAFILNRAGEFQTKPNPARLVYKDFFLGLLAKSQIESSSQPIDSSSTHAMVSAKDEITSGEARYADKNIFYLMIPLKRGDWILAYQQDAEDAFRDLSEARLLTIGIALVGAIAIVMMAVLLSRRMVNYVEKADREKEMMNERVIEAGKLASVGELAAGIAHEINNPVAIMVEEAGWMGDLIDEEELQQSKNLDEFKAALKQIRTQGERCKEITHKLLSFARSTDPRARQIQVNELIEELISISEQRSRFGNVKIISHLAPDLPEISASPSEIQQVLLNLINNAIDAIGPAGGTVEITTRVEGNRLVIDVADTGHGIPQAVMQRIFDPFFTTKPVGKGTGLGLSICYGIIKKIGGDISVNSAVDVGTAFHVQLPLPREGQKGHS